MTLMVCNPHDEWHVRMFHRQFGDRARLVTSERCPTQVVIHLADRLLLLVQSGAWFDTAAQQDRYVAAALERRMQLEALLANGMPRCQAITVGWTPTQCQRGAAGGKVYCKHHEKKRRIFDYHIGEGLDERSDNPLSTVSLDALSKVSQRLGSVLWDLGGLDRLIEEQPALGERIGKAYAELVELRDELTAIIRGDREKESRLRSELGIRIQRMVEQIAEIRRIEGRDVHLAFIRQGGKKHEAMSLEELKGKVDWLYQEYGDCFPADTREWEAEGSERTGMEPGFVKRAPQSA